MYSSQVTTVQVVQASKDLPAGTLINEDMIKTVKVGEYGLSDKVARLPENVVGKVTTDYIYSGENIWSTRLIEEAEYIKSEEERTKGLEGDLRIVALQFPTVSSGIPTMLRGGHYVDVYESVENFETGKIEIKKALGNMHVYDVLNSSLLSLNDLDEQASKLLTESTTDFDFKPVYVVFRCTDTQAQELIRLECEKTMHLVLTKTGE